MSVYRLKAGDLEPPLEVTVSDGVATFADASSWAVEVLLPDGTVILDNDPDVTVAVGGTSAAIAHAWVDGETDQTGTYRVEVKAFWPETDRPQTFPPNQNPLSFKVYEDLA